MNPALRCALIAGFTLFVVITLSVMGLYFEGAGSDFTARNLAPALGHPFGTDHMGRDLFTRSLAALSLSLWLGLLAAALSTLIALFFALLSGLGQRMDRIATFVIDAMLALPHLMLLILLVFALGGGALAMILAIAFSHWPRLARLLRAEVHHLRQAPYIAASRSFGKSRLWVFFTHMMPHLLPQALIGFTLTFPHAVLHEAGLSFLGFGLEPTRPAIGVMLAEAMTHLTAGRWWLAFFPGVMLLSLALLFETLGQSLYRLIGGRSC